MFCPRCGNDNKKGAKYCVRCGTDLPKKGQNLVPQAPAAVEIPIPQPQQEVLAQPAYAPPQQNPAQQPVFAGQPAAAGSPAMGMPQAQAQQPMMYPAGMPPIIINNQVSSQNINQNNVGGGQMVGGESYFDGTLSTYVGWVILGYLLTVFTLGICYPWALCMVYGWRINHTVVQGRRLRFTGSAIGLFGNWIKWFLLCLVTLGIYSFWLGIELEKWKVKNTIFS